MQVAGGCCAGAQAVRYRAVRRRRGVGLRGAGDGEAVRRGWVLGALPKVRPMDSVSGDWDEDDDGFRTSAGNRLIAENRRAMRTVFTHEDWLRHMSPYESFRHVVQSARSRILAQVAPEACFHVGLAALVAVANWALGGASGSPALSAPPQVFELTAPSLGLLLVFRTEASYSRWVEARKLVGQLVNDSRKMMRVCLQVGEEDATVREAIVRYNIAFCRSFMANLRPSYGPCCMDMRTELAKTLTEQESERIVSATSSPPLFVLHCLCEAIESAGVASNRGADAICDSYADTLGNCERLFKTPIPRAYTHHSSRFLFIWLALLPLALVREFPNVFEVVPAEAFVAVLLLGIKQIGITIEEPFGVLPLEELCDLIQKECIEAVSERKLFRELVTCTRGDEALRNEAAAKLNMWWDPKDKLLVSRPCEVE